MNSQVTAERSKWASGTLTLAFALAWVLIVLATVFRGGNRFVPLMALEWLALGVLVLLGWAVLAAGRWPSGWGQAANSAGWRWGLLALVGAPLGLGLAQVLAATGTTPLASWAGALAALPVVAMLAVGLSASAAHLQTLWRAWLWVALAQAAVGLMQVGSLPVVAFSNEGYERVIGTFASKNTYSNFMVMAIPLTVLGLLAPAGRRSRSEQSSKPWLWGAALFVLLAAISLSTSRTGIGTALLTVLLSVALLAPARKAGGADQRSGWNRRWLWLGAAALLGAVALAGGLDWVDRFDADRLATDGATRALMRDATWQGAMAHWPWGSGLGSYRWVFPAFHPPELGRYLIDMAHNDYLQLLMELGVWLVALLALALALVARRALALGRAMGQQRSGWPEADRLAVACGLGALATALHALVDYPFHIPANAMLAAFLLGVFLREPCAENPP